MTVYNYNAPDISQIQGAFSQLASSNQALAQRQMQQNAIDLQQKQSKAAMIGAVGGAVVGGSIGGFGGASLGASIGSQIGNASAGGKVDQGAVLQTALAAGAAGQQAQTASAEKNALSAMQTGGTMASTVPSAPAAAAPPSASPVAGPDNSGSIAAGANMSGDPMSVMASRDAALNASSPAGDPLASAQQDSGELAEAPNAAMQASPEAVAAATAGAATTMKAPDGSTVPVNAADSRTNAILAAARGSATPLATAQSALQLASIIHPPPSYQKVGADESLVEVNPKTGSAPKVVYSNSSEGMRTLTPTEVAADPSLANLPEGSVVQQHLGGKNKGQYEITKGASTQEKGGSQAGLDNMFLAKSIASRMGYDENTPEYHSAVSTALEGIIKEQKAKPTVDAAGNRIPGVNVDQIESNARALENQKRKTQGLAPLGSAPSAPIQAAPQASASQDEEGGAAQVTPVVAASGKNANTVRNFSPPAGGAPAVPIQNFATAKPIDDAQLDKVTASVQLQKNIDAMEKFPPRGRIMGPLGSAGAALGMDKEAGNFNVLRSQFEQKLIASVPTRTIDSDKDRAAIMKLVPEMNDTPQERATKLRIAREGAQATMAGKLDYWKQNSLSIPKQLEDSVQEAKTLTEKGDGSAAHPLRFSTKDEAEKATGSIKEGQQFLLPGETIPRIFHKALLKTKAS